MTERDRVVIQAILDETRANGEQRISLQTAPDIVLKQPSPPPVDTKPIADAMLSLETAAVSRLQPLVDAVLSTKAEPADLNPILVAIQEQGADTRALVESLMQELAASRSVGAAADAALMVLMDKVAAALDRVTEKLGAPRQPVSLEIVHSSGGKSIVKDAGR